MVGRQNKIQTILFHRGRARPKTNAIIGVWNWKNTNIGGIVRRLQLIDVERQSIIFAK
jgi:hypothetical protein